MKRTRSDRDRDDGVAAAADVEDVPPCGATVESPHSAKKRQRDAVVVAGRDFGQERERQQPSALMELEDKEEHHQQAEWNLLADLPYVALRRLLDFFLSDSDPNAAAAAGVAVPELLRVRAESAPLCSRDLYDEEVPPGEEVAHEEKISAEAKRLRALPLYHVPETRQGHLQRERLHGCWSSLGALRLTCRDIKSAVDHALGGGGVNSSLPAGLVAATALYAPLDRFLTEHAFPPGCSSGNRELPLLPETPAAARTKAWFREMADVTLGTAQARLHQARLGEVLDYVWREWEYAPAKLSALRQQLLCSQSQRAGEVDQQRQQPPLLKVEYVQREDDYLGSSYAIGVNSCISLGLADMPHERVEIWLSALQAWDHRGDGWDLQVFVSLRTSSDAWRQRLLSSSSSTTPDGDNGGLGDGDDGDNAKDADDDDDDDGDGDGGKDETKAESIEKGRPLRLVLLDYSRSSGEIDDTPSIRFDILCKVWQSVGLAAERTDGEADGDGEDEGEIKQWNGTEVLTTLLACLGFAWKDDVKIVLDDCNLEDDDAEHEGGGGAAGVTLFEEHSISGLFRACRHKSRVLSEWRQQAEQLSGLLEANTRSAPNEASGIKSLELAVRRIRRFIAQQRLSRAVSHISQRAQGTGPWASQIACPELLRLDGREVAKELHVIYARTMDLSPGEYSNLFDTTVELGWRVRAEALLRVQDDLIEASPSSVVGEANDSTQQLLGGVELVIGVSSKVDNCYTGTHEQEMVTVRVVGHHPQLRATLDHFAASVQIEECDDGVNDDGNEDEHCDGEGEKKKKKKKKQGGGSKEAGVVVLQLKCEISDMGVSRKIVATEAIEFVGRLLGLSLRAGTDTAARAPYGRHRRYGGRVPDLHMTPFAQSVLAFVREATMATTWDADEGTFPVHSALRQMWDNGDEDDDGREDLGHDHVLAGERERLCGPAPFSF